MNGLDTSTLPSPGSGYSYDEQSWWKDPLRDLLEGATGRIEEALELEGPELTTPPPPPPARAELVPQRLQAPLALAAALGLGWFLLRR